MRNMVRVAGALALLWPTLALAQATPPVQQFAYCSVNDSGRHDIWVSQIFPAPPHTDALGTELAKAFHDYVGTLGGAGDKQCVVGARPMLEDLRLKIAGIMGRRSMGIRVYSWHDVQWTPSPAMYARTVAPPPAAAEASYVYCRTTDADTRTQVTSEVFVAALPAANVAERYATLERYSHAFARSAASLHGVAPEASCIASDTQAEADKSRNDYRHAFRFSGIKGVAMPWTPDPALASPSPSAPVQPVAIPQAPAPAPAVDTGLQQRIATEKFFQLPAGAGVPTERSGTRTIGTIPVLTKAQVKRLAGGNACQLHTESTAGSGATSSTSTIDGSTWAGLMPLESTMQMRNAFGVSGFTVRTLSVDALQGQPFPLVQGNTFGYTFLQRTFPASGNPVDTTVTLRCEVGATTPAGDGMTGEQTELQCTHSFSTPGLNPQPLRVHWYSAVGCFVQDVGR